MFDRYNYILLGTIVCAALVVAYIGSTIQPLDGDLTRIGGYSEKDFGWQPRQESFETDYLFKIAHSLQDYDQHFDVVVLGDSFTLRPGISWANFFIAATGLSIISFHHNDLSVEEIVYSPQFRASPPVLFVYESAERSVVKRLADVGYLQGEAVAPSKSLGLQVEPVKHAMEVRQRQTKYDNLTLRVSEAIHTLKTNIATSVFGTAPRTISLPLRNTEKRLFSSRNQTDILVYRDDITVREGWRTHWEDAIAGYRRLSELVESNGSTNLVTLVFPDKLNVYANYLVSDQWQNSSVIPFLAAERSLSRLDLRFNEAVEQGMIDVYLPNNTHTGSKANQIAMNEILNHLKERQIIAR